MGRFLARFAIIVLWLALVLLAPLLVPLAGLDFAASWGEDTSWFTVPLIWFLCLLATAPWIGRRLNTDLLEPADAPPLPAPPPHLPGPLRDILAEADAIHHDLAATRLDVCLTRAWELANTIDLLAPDLRGALERTGASLTPVRALVDRRAADRRAPKARQLTDLDHALAEFRRALVRAPTGFRS